MTTFFIYMGEMQTLKNLEKLCLIEKDPGEDLFVYDRVVFSDGQKQDESQMTLSEAAKAISRKIDMETLLRERFSVVVYVTGQEEASRQDYSYEAPQAAAYEAFSILQVQYELLKTFWDCGKYPEHIRITFGEYGVINNYLIDAFETKREETEQAVWNLLWPEDPLPEYCKKADVEKIRKTPPNIEAWTFLEGLGFQDKLITATEGILKKLREKSSGTQPLQVPGSRLLQAVTNVFWNIFREIGKLTPGREKDLNEQEATILVERFHLEKENDPFEATRNEVMIFLYVYSRAWEKRKGVYIENENANPEALICSAPELPTVVNLEKAAEVIQEKRRILNDNLEIINPDQALRIAVFENNDIIELEKELLWDEERPSQKKETGKTREKKKTEWSRFILNSLFLSSARNIRTKADFQCDEIEEANRSLERRLKEYSEKIEGTFRERKYLKLSQIEKKIDDQGPSTSDRIIRADQSFMQVTAGKTEQSISDVENRILEAEKRQFYWPGDISELIAETREKVKALYERMRWYHLLGMILAPVLFLILFLLPYYILADKKQPLMLLYFGVTAGIAFAAYLLSCICFMMKYKQGVCNAMDHLLQEWQWCNDELIIATSHFEETLSTYMPKLFGQYQYRARLKEIETEAEEQKSKITYHRTNLEEQKKSLQSLAESMDLKLDRLREEKTEKEPLNEKNRISLRNSMFSKINRPIYGLTPEEAKIMIGLLERKTAKEVK